MYYSNYQFLKLSILFSLTVILFDSCESTKNIATSEEESETVVIEQKEEIEKEETQEPTPLKILEDAVYDESIHTVLAHKIGFELAPPVFQLNIDGEGIQIHFDDFESDVETFYYEIIHCNANWVQSGLIPSEYLKGMYQSPMIRDYDYSFNTYQDYIHYWIDLPNRDLNFTKSGNYIISVYRNNDTEDVLFTKRFMVYEDLVNVEAIVKQPSLLDLKNYYQEVDFNIKHGSFEIKNPFRNLTVVMRQNNRWDNAVKDLKPKFMRENTLIYNYDAENIFEGGNEFRFVNAKNLLLKGQNIADIRSDSDKKYHITLKPDIKRPYKIYFTRSDINGKFLVKNERRNDSNVEADYAYFHFNLPFDFPVNNGDIYLFGAFSDWQFKEEFKLKYNNNRKAYETVLYLKQGYYNYCYALLENNKKTAEIAFIEGSHYNTENDYSIEVYHRDLFDDYDRLIGVRFFNSQNF